jgi:hypothetical protein
MMTNRFNNLDWYSFLYPNQSAALEATKEQNQQMMQYNRQQDLLEAFMSLQLTEKEDKKIVIIIILVIIGIVLYKF